MPDEAIRIDIPLTPGEKELKSNLLKKPEFRLTAPSGFDLPVAWELANLTRIAYKDYEVFNEEAASDRLGQPRRTLKTGSTLYASKRICQDVIDNYLIDDLASEAAPASADQEFGGDYFQYKICSVYTFLAYTAGIPPKPDVDRFGFVAQRKLPDGSIHSYVVFRGTREPEEWFNNFQFKQVPFLMRSPESEPSPIKISLGFNKMYTGYRPGLFIENEVTNRYSRWIDEKLAEASRRQFPEEHRLHSESIMESIEHLLKPDTLESSKIYVTGHSLGAALASIAALHISQALHEEGREAQLALYTFASPRVGNQYFAEQCTSMFTCFRIANSEDIVTTLPPPTFRLIGEEMLPSSVVDEVRNVVSKMSGGISADVNEHIGTSICFTAQMGEISSNHNMSATYCHALSRIDG